MGGNNTSLLETNEKLVMPCKNSNIYSNVPVILTFSLIRETNRGKIISVNVKNNTNWEIKK